VRVGERFIKRALGPKRAPGSREGLTKAQAEARLRDLMDELRAAPPIVERMRVTDAGERRDSFDLEHVMQRKPTTIQDYPEAQAFDEGKSGAGADRMHAYASFSSGARAWEDRLEALASVRSRQRSRLRGDWRHRQGRALARRRSATGLMMSSPASTVQQMSASMRAGWTTGTNRLRPPLSSM
jgi:hypothetical protein